MHFLWETDAVCPDSISWPLLNLSALVSENCNSIFTQLASFGAITPIYALKRGSCNSEPEIDRS